MVRGKSITVGMTWALMSTMVAIPMSITVLTPQVARAEAPALSAAQAFYDAGKFTDAVTALKTALSQGQVTGRDIVRAKELLGRSQAKAGDTAGGHATFLGLLRQDPLYRLDKLRTPPDEVAVFDQALRTFEAEQHAASRRQPASISLFYGIGSGENKDFGEYVVTGGGDEKFEHKPEFGMGVRFPLRPRLSFDLEIQRFKSTNEDSATGAGPREKSTYELSALPLVFSLHYAVRDAGKMRVGVFAGAGPMLNSYASVTDPSTFGVTIKVTDSKVGTYFHAGVEGEYALHPKLALNARALFRSAKASGMYEGLDYNQYGSPITPATLARLGDRDLDFSGYGLSLGLRGYIGY
ncbi:MAG: tetratricopeptide repeat protein [Candidatus Eisenbacteria bacterium]